MHVEQFHSSFTLNQQKNDLQLICACKNEQRKRLAAEFELCERSMRKLAGASPFLIRMTKKKCFEEKMKSRSESILFTEKVTASPIINSIPSQKESEPKEESKEENKETEAEEDIYARKPELLATERPIRKLLAFDWASGFVSPFRPSPKETLQKVFARISSSAPKCILDLGCGDGEALIAALKFFASTRVIGIELDEKLLQSAHENLQKENLRDRALLFCGDFLSTDPLRSRTNQDGAIDTRLAELLSSVDCIFVYLLPEALRKLIPLLTKEILRGGTVISMQWEAVGLEQFLVLPHETTDGYFIYRGKKNYE